MIAKFSSFLLRFLAFRIWVLLLIFAITPIHAKKAYSQNLNDQIILPATRTSRTAAVVRAAPTGTGADVLPSPPPPEALINADLLARAAIFADDTRLADFANGAFLPSAIPVAGQPFFGSGPRANLQGSGSAVRINAYSPSSADYQASAHAQFMLQSANFPTIDSGTSTFSVRQVYATLNRITVGAMDSAFSDPSAVPETIDLAGPSARITAYDAGLSGGQGRLSYDLFSEGSGGFKVIGSVEQGIPQIANIGDTNKSFSHIPDFVVAPQYVAGDFINGQFVESWHLQLATVMRDIAFETPLAAEQNVFGWGAALSGAYRFSLNPNLDVMDRIMFSVAYGQGISRYIVDLNAASDTGDAVIDGMGALTPLPALAWYAGYTHNWTNCLRSTVTYSRVDLNSVVPLGATASPYNSGDYLSVNLIRHLTFYASEEPDAAAQNVYVGIEYLHGNKETLDGQTGEAHRLMFVVAISN